MLPPIDDYAMLGDTRTAALVASDGSIDWLCVPRFDGQPVFGRLVGGFEAGSFRLGPAGPVDPRGPTGPVVVRARRYRPGSATLETTWETPDGPLTLTEAMVGEVAGRLLPTTLLVRRLTADAGPVNATLLFDPRLGARRRRPRGEHRGEILVCSWPGVALALHTSPRLQVEPGQPVTVRVEPGRPLTVAVAVADREPLVHVTGDAAWAALEADERAWRAWCQGIDDDLPHRDMVLRSLLTLRLLTYSPTGAPVAAPTTSLPEHLGGVRNWDYRYAWPRDASIGIGAFLGVGKHQEARRFMAWLLHATRLNRPLLPVLLTVHGRHPAAESEFTGWPGYADSRPVRQGNGAADQHQLDGYGWVLDAAWLLTRAGHGLYAETWRAMAGFADTVAARWRRPDAGIWEVRGPAAHHVHSKLMAWLALDRALRIADHRAAGGRGVGGLGAFGGLGGLGAFGGLGGLAGFGGAGARRRERWRRERDALAAEIGARGFDAARGTYTRSFGSTDLDAALLVLPLLGIEPAESPRVHGTIDAIRRDLDAGGPLLYRYPPGRDGLPGAEGAFLPCSFWLVQALAASGRASEATDLFDALIALASPVGLYAEEMDPATRNHLGNFPQALTHAALVQAALAIRDAAGASAPSRRQPRIGDRSA